MGIARKLQCLRMGFWDFLVVELLCESEWINANVVIFPTMIRGVWEEHRLVLLISEMPATWLGNVQGCSRG